MQPIFVTKLFLQSAKQRFEGEEVQSSKPGGGV